MQQSEKFIIYCVNSDHMLEIDQKVTHGFGPSIPSNSLVHFIWVYMQFSYFSLSSTNKERDSKLLGVLNTLCLKDIL